MKTKINQPMQTDGKEKLLSSTQGHIVGNAITCLAFVAIIGFFTFVFFILKAFVLHFSDVLWPIATATILTLLLQPCVHGIEAHLKLKRPYSILLLYTAGLAAVASILGILLPIFIGQLIAFIQFIPELVLQFESFIKEHLKALGPWADENLDNETLQNIINQPLKAIKSISLATLPSLQEARHTITSFIAWVTGLAIVPVYLFYFLNSNFNIEQRLRGELDFLKKSIREDILFLVEEFLNILVAFFRGQILIGLIMGVAYGLGFTIAGVKFGLMLGLMLGLLNIIPYLGTIIGLSTILPIAYFQPEGGLSLVGIAIGVFIFVQALEGYFLTPRIMGHKTGLHPVAIIVSIFFWGTALGGILGMVLAVPLTAFLIVAWRLLKRKYLPHFSER